MRSSVAIGLGLTMLASVPLVSQRATPRPAAPAGRQTPATGRSAPPTGRAAPVPSRATEPRVESTVPFRVGETLTYDVSWSSFLVAGTAVISVKEKKPSEKSTAYYVVAEARPVALVGKLYSLYYKLDSLVDAYGLLSQYGSLYSEEGSRHRFVSTHFDRGAGRAMFERKTATTQSAAMAVPPQTQDGLAAFYSLRGRTFKPGERLSIPIVDGQALYTVNIDAGASETIKVPLGQMSASKLNLSIVDAAGKPVRKDIAVWMSNDARHIPVKVQAQLAVGSFVLGLREAR